MNNGFASDLFEIKRGVRQGDPLSPYLFIIALEILNVAIRKNKGIEGIALGRNEIKLNVFADDLTTFVKNTKSFHLLVTLLEGYGKISGLKVNEEKTEAYRLGSSHATPKDIGISTVNKPMGLVPSPMCSFCEKSEESLEHLFIYCDTSKDFWFSVIEWLKEHSFGVNHLSALDITFGLISKENLLLNHIIILGKHVIYQSRSLNIKPTLMLLKAKIRSTYQIESFIAEKK